MKRLIRMYLADYFEFLEAYFTSPSVLAKSVEARKESKSPPLFENESDILERILDHAFEAVVETGKIDALVDLIEKASEEDLKLKTVVFVSDPDEAGRVHDSLCISLDAERVKAYQRKFPSRG